MDNLIDEILKCTSLVRVIGGEKNASLTLVDGLYCMFCPFCERSHERSLTISKDQTRWNCRVCSLAGDLTKFLMLRDNIGYYEALRTIGVLIGAIPDNPDTDQVGRSIENPRESEIAIRSRIKLDGPVLGVRGFQERDKNYLRKISSLVSKPPILDNVAFPKVMLIDWFGIGRRSFDQIGIVSAVYPNLQTHCKLEYPNYEYKIFDEEELHDAGSVIWTDNAYGIIKDMRRPGNHYPEVKVQAITTSGFCLIKPPEVTQSCWIAPRDPRGKGRNRPMTLKTGGIIALESIIVDPREMSGYVDISGLTVELNPPEYGSQRYPES